MLDADLRHFAQGRLLAVDGAPGSHVSGGRGVSVGPRSGGERIPSATATQDTGGADGSPHPWEPPLLLTGTASLEKDELPG